MADHDKDAGPPPPSRTKGGAGSTKRKSRRSVVPRESTTTDEQSQPVHNSPAISAVAGSTGTPAQPPTGAPEGQSSATHGSSRLRRLEPRTPVPPPPRKVSAGGSVLRGRREKAAIKELDEAYPIAFLPLKRASFRQTSMYNIRFTNITWQPDPNPPTADEMTKMKNKLNILNRKAHFVFCSSDLSAYIARKNFPEISTLSERFWRLYDYCNQSANTMKQELLWKRMYKLVMGWTRDYKEDFRFNEDYANLAAKDQDDYFKDEDVKHTKKWVYARLDRVLYKHIFSHIADYLDWDDNFADRSKLPYFYLKTLFYTLIRRVAETYMVERRHMIDTDRGNVKWVFKSTDWHQDEKHRNRCNTDFDKMCVYPAFSQVEINIFKWRQPVVVAPVEKAFDPTAYWQQTTDSPPPPASPVSGNSSDEEDEPVLVTSLNEMPDEDIYGASPKLKGAAATDPFDVFTTPRTQAKLDKMAADKSERERSDIFVSPASVAPISDSSSDIEQPPKRTRTESPPKTTSAKKRPPQPPQGWSMTDAQGMHLTRWMREQESIPEIAAQVNTLRNHIGVCRETSDNFDEFFTQLQQYAQHLKNNPYATGPAPPAAPPKPKITPIPPPKLPLPPPKPKAAPGVESVKRTIKETPVPPPSFGPYKPTTTPATELPVVELPDVEKHVIEKPVVEKPVVEVSSHSESDLSSPIAPAPIAPAPIAPAPIPTNSYNKFVDSKDMDIFREWLMSISPIVESEFCDACNDAAKMSIPVLDKLHHLKQVIMAKYKARAQAELRKNGLPITEPATTEPVPDPVDKELSPIIEETTAPPSSKPASPKAKSPPEDPSPPKPASPKPASPKAPSSPKAMSPLAPLPPIVDEQTIIRPPLYMPAARYGMQHNIRDAIVSDLYKTEKILIQTGRQHMLDELYTEYNKIGHTTFEHWNSRRKAIQALVQRLVQPTPPPPSTPSPPPPREPTPPPQVTRDDYESFYVEALANMRADPNLPNDYLDFFTSLKVACDLADDNYPTWQNKLEFLKGAVAKTYQEWEADKVKQERQAMERSRQQEAERRRQMDEEEKIRRASEQHRRIKEQEAARRTAEEARKKENAARLRAAVEAMMQVEARKKEEEAAAARAAAQQKADEEAAARAAEEAKQAEAAESSELSLPPESPPHSPPKPSQQPTIALGTPKMISPIKPFEHRPSPIKPLPLPLPAINVSDAETSTPPRKLRSKPSFARETAASRARNVSQSQESTPAPASTAPGTLRRTRSTRGSLRDSQASATPDPNRIGTRSQSRMAAASGSGTPSGTAANNSPPVDTPTGYARGGRGTIRRGKKDGRGGLPSNNHHDDFDFEEYLLADESIDPIDFYKERIAHYRAGYI